MNQPADAPGQRGPLRRVNMVPRLGKFAHDGKTVRAMDRVVKDGGRRFVGYGSKPNSRRRIIMPSTVAGMGSRGRKPLVR